jgi:hypothetical protein
MLKCVLVRLDKNRVDLTGSAARHPHGNLVARVMVVVGSVGQPIKIAMLRVKNALPFLEC